MLAFAELVAGEIAEAIVGGILVRAYWIRSVHQGPRFFGREFGFI